MRSEREGTIKMIEEYPLVFPTEQELELAIPTSKFADALHKDKGFTSHYTGQLTNISLRYLRK